MAEINATPGRLVWVQINDENYKGYATEDVFIPEERETFTFKPKKVKEKPEATTAKPSVTITQVQTTEKLVEPEALTPPSPPPPITDFYPPSKPSSTYGVKSTTQAPAPKQPAPQDKKKGLLTSLFSLIFPSGPKTKKKKEEKKTETTTEKVEVFIPDETTTTTERHYLPPPPSPTEPARPATTPRTTAAPTTKPTTTTTTTVAPAPVHVHHIIQPIHIPQRIPIPQPVHVHQPVHQVHQVHQPVHVPAVPHHHLPQSPIQLVGLQQFSLPVCTSSPVSTFQRCLPAAAARLPLAHQTSTIAQVPLNAGFVRLPRNINQPASQPVVDYRDGVEHEGDYSDIVADLEYYY